MMKKWKLKEIGEECRKYVEYFYKDEKKDLALKIIEKFKYKKCIEDLQSQLGMSLTNLEFQRILSILFM